MKDSRKISYDRLIHMQNAIIKIEDFVNNTDRYEFLSNSLVSSAILHQFNILGEAVIYIEKDLLEKYYYPWYKIRAFRNFIAHEYFNIKLDAVWEIILNDLPELKNMVELVLKNEF